MASNINGCISEYRCTIATENGSEFDALEVAKGAIGDWGEIINKLNI